MVFISRKNSENIHLQWIGKKSGFPPEKAKRVHLRLQRQLRRQWNNFWSNCKDVFLQHKKAYHYIGVLDKATSAHTKSIQKYEILNKLSEQGKIHQSCIQSLFCKGVNNLVFHFHVIIHVLNHQSLRYKLVSQIKILFIKHVSTNSLNRA